MYAIVKDQLDDKKDTFEKIDKVARDVSILEGKQFIKRKKKAIKGKAIQRRKKTRWEKLNTNFSEKNFLWFFSIHIVRFLWGHLIESSKCILNLKELMNHAPNFSIYIKSLFTETLKLVYPDQ